MKITLKRLKKGIKGVSDKAPDYVGFFESQRGYFYMKGWFSSSLSADINLYVEKITDQWKKENRRTYLDFIEWERTRHMNNI